MVLIAPILGAAVFLTGFAAALPTNPYEDSSSNYGGNSYDKGNNYGGGSYDKGNNYGGNYEPYEPKYDTKVIQSTSTEPKMMKETTTPMMMKETTTTPMMMKETTTTPMMMKETTTPMMEKPKTTMMEEKSTKIIQSTSVPPPKETPSYGSGKSYWGGSGYDDCVNQCIAKYGSPEKGGSYQATQTSGNSGSKGTGATHTVIVAPTKGVFRMVPFAVNASTGDTIEFHWGASNHTVTKSSALTPCNKSSDAPIFASGEQNQGFVFTQVVNDTNPTFYYCATAGHCPKGMFGVINPQMAVPGAPTSLGGMMQTMAKDDSDLSAYAAYSSNVTTNNAAASTWGTNFEMNSIPDWARSLFAENVLYTRAVLAMNSEVLKTDNSVDLASVAATPLMLPMDIKEALDNSNSAPSPAAPGGAAGGAPGASGAQAAAAAPAAQSPAASSPAPSNGASSIVSSKFAVALFVAVATFFAL
ncbi:Phytocyanin domain-containing protein [Mycena indigotica]|uniref:Phytocyanin domain-containing protein n=1 Tax=Mycena indigotica TaxID=2126181 RepID=A0A8H6SA78_9AGAR|nr:Phytocyanin domain-containing protein [Mycena indigotica]KAF7294971.1 Phytocyanin domain-containing protein [Mycena indigotica]